jgi:hypothetical protein
MALFNLRRGDLLVGSEAGRRTEYSARRTRARINTKLFSRVLKDFAQHFRAGKNKRIILIRSSWMAPESSVGGA